MSKLSFQFYWLIFWIISSLGHKLSSIRQCRYHEYFGAADIDQYYEVFNPEIHNIGDISQGRYSRHLSPGYLVIMNEANKFSILEKMPDVLDRARVTGQESLSLHDHDKPQVLVALHTSDQHARVLADSVKIDTPGLVQTILRNTTLLRGGNLSSCTSALTLRPISRSVLALPRDPRGRIQIPKRCSEAVLTGLTEHWLIVLRAQQTYTSPVAIIKSIRDGNDSSARQ